MRKISKNNTSKSFVERAVTLVIVAVFITNTFILAINHIPVRADDNPVKIMPLGDSITWGHASGVEDDNKKVSYRKYLWDNLTEAGYSVDFVGSLVNGEFYAGFDPDHEGHGGWTDDQIATNIYNNGGYNWIATYEPDIILLHIGTNGLHPSPDDVEDILDEIDEYESDYGREVTVILARIIIKMSFPSSDTTEFNDNVEAMARDRVENSSNPAYPDDIIFVDMEDGAGIIYDITPAGDMWDLIHPFATGYAKMATVWFNALEGLLTPTGPSFSLKINCGGPTIVDGSITWEASSSYLPTGVNYSFDLSSVDTAANSIAEPVPPLAVYNNVSRASPHTYNISQVPDGNYIVRIHWIDKFDAYTRRIDYDIEGVRVQDDWDIVAEAGGAGIAIDKEYIVTVSDGNGMQIVSSNDSGADAFESAIEITATQEEPEPPSCPENMTHYWKLNETSGSTYEDSYGSLDGSCTNCPTPATGIVSGAQDFDGSSEYITVPDDDSLDWGSTDSFTIELWANFTNVTNRNKVMIGRDDRPVPGVHWWLGANQDTGTTNWNMKATDGSGGGVTGTTSINDGHWHHIVAVRDESNNDNRLYVDGVKENNTIYEYSAGFDATTTLGIGYMAYHLTPDYYYDGLLDEIALYNRALSDAEILSHYNNGLAGTGYCEAGASAPSITSTPVTTGAVGQLYTYDVDATGSPTPAYALDQYPTGMTINSDTGLIEWMPGASGDYGVTVNATNSEGFDTQSFTITVLVCPLDMIHYWKLDETAGPPYVDFFGTNDATCTNCPTATTGIVGGAQSFDGVSDEVDVADDDTFDWASDDSFTIEYWMNTSESTAGNRVLVGRDDTGSNLHWWIGCEGNGKVRFQLRDVNGNGAYIGNKSYILNDGVWHHIVAVRDESQDKNFIYVDGVKIDEAPHDYTAGFGSSTELNIGHLNSGFKYNGILDEIALYNKALTPTEILSHYNNGLAGKGYCEAGASAPSITSTPVTMGTVGQLYTYDVDATGSPTPAYALDQYPTGMTINSNTGLIEWMPSVSGNYDVTVNATNSEGFDTQEFTIQELSTSVAIMPLGDSITDGAAGSTDNIGYRRSLYLNLTNAGYDVDFVGSLNRGIPTDFDRDHEGHGGWTDSQIAFNIYNNGGENWISTYTPNVILLHIGTNGLDSNPSDVEDILNEIDDYETDNSANVKVILARIINRQPYSQTTTDFNDNVEAMALARNDPDITIVDMENGAGINYATDMADIVHPNDVGYEKMATAWFNALEGLLAPTGVSVFNVVLTASSPHNTVNDNLTCTYNLGTNASTAATAWYKDGSPDMVLYMPMEGNASNALKDYSGNSNSITTSGNPTWQSTGAYDSYGYFDFDGDDYLDAGNIMPLDAYTKSAWVYWIPGNYMNNILSGESGHAFWVTDYPENVDVHLSAGHAVPWRAVKDPAVFPDNVWIFVTVTYDPAVDGGTMTLYRNGNEVDDATGVSLIGNSDSRLYVGSYNGGANFKGHIDDARIYDHALSPEQIQVLYNSGSGNNNLIVSQETSVGDIWQARVTPFNDTVAGTTIKSNNVTIQEVPVCPTDMIHYWKLDETSGSPYVDSYGGNDATCSSCPTATTGIVGGAQSFDGSSDEVDVADDDTFDWAADDSFTIEYWMKTGESTSGNRVLVGRDDWPLHWWIGCEGNGKVRFQLRDVNGNGAYIGNESYILNDGVWHHIVAVRDESQDKNFIYVDGVKIDEAPHDYTAGFGSSTELNIGHLNSGFKYNGILDEIALYNKALTPTEILSHYNNGLAGTGYCEACVPDIISTPVITGAVGQLYTYGVETTGNPVPEFSLLVKPAGMTINSNTGLIEWTPSASGDYDVTVNATNPGGFDTQSFTIAVSEAPVCPTDMIHYWKLDETSGSPYVDFFGTNDATCSSCPTATTGIVNGAQSFDGTIDEVNVADGDTFDWAADDSFTIEYWMNTSESTDGNRVLVGRDDAGSNLHWWIGCWGSGKVAFGLLDINANGIFIGGGSALNNGVWHHIVAVRDESTNENRIYVDGVKIDDDTHDYTAGFGGSTDLNIGYLNLGDRYRYNGILDEIALYDKALTPTEILSHYNNGLAGTGYCEACVPDIISTPVITGAVGQLYTYGVETTGNPVPEFSLLVKPAGMTINSNTGLIEWTPGASGDYSVTVNATNSEGFDTQSFTITVSEAPVCPLDMTHYWKFDETSGSPYEDSYGGNNATCSSCPTATTGIVNGAQSFDGTIDEVNVADGDTFDWAADDSFTIEYWMNTSESTDGNRVLVGRDDWSLHWWIGCEGNGKVRFQLRDVNGNGAYIGNKSYILNDGVWHHIVAVRDESQDKNFIYVDGAKIDEATHNYTAGFDSNTELNIGHLNSGYKYNGILDEIALYNRALTPSEIQQHYSNGLNGTGYCVASLIEPSITSTAVTNATVGQLYTYNLNATGNPAPTFSLDTYPTSMTINSTTGLIEWTPVSVGDFEVTVNASNSIGWDTQNFNINVSEQIIPGDANGDGIVNAVDITYIELIILGQFDSTPGADANQDGEINAIDITKTELIILGV